MKTSRLKVLSSTVSTVVSLLSRLCNFFVARRAQDRTTLRIEPTAYGGNGAMIQQHKGLGKIVASTVIAALVMLGSTVSAQSLKDVFSFENASMTWVENSGADGDEYTELVRIITASTQSASLGEFCITVKGAGVGMAADAVCDGANDGSKGVLGSNLAVGSFMGSPDYEMGGKHQSIVVTATKTSSGTSTLKTNKLTIAVTVVDDPEVALAKDAFASMAELRPVRPMEKVTLRVTDVFEDPEGDAIAFDGDSIAVCGGSEITAPVETNLADVSSLTCTATDGTLESTDFASAKVNTSGRLLTIDVTAKDGATPNNYYVDVYVKTKAPNASVNYAVVKLGVKVGANNIPQFAGGATGYKASIAENATAGTVFTIGTTNQIPPAGDLDSYDSGNLVYSLMGQDSEEEVTVFGTGKVKLNRVRNEEDPPGIVGLQLIAAGAFDFEGAAGTMDTVHLIASDRWDSTEPVKIDLTITDVNELDKAKAEVIEAVNNQRITITGKERNIDTFSIDLEKIFLDPDKDAKVTYEHFTEDVLEEVAVISDHSLTLDKEEVMKLIPKADSPQKSFVVKVFAMDGKGEEENAEFTVHVRHSNEKPVIGDENVISYGATIEENHTGEFGPSIPYTDEDEAEGVEYSAPVSGKGSDLFKATAKDGVVKVRVAEGAKIDFENGNHPYMLVIGVNDGWDPSEKTVSLHVSVTDMQENPYAKEVMEGELDQKTVVRGTAMIDVAKYFDDDDAKSTRLLIHAEIPDVDEREIVDVDVTGLANVVLSGKAMGDAMVSIWAEDSDSKTSDPIKFKVTVGKNNPPKATREVADVTIQEGSFKDIDLMDLFEDPDNGDMITGVSVVTSDESKVLVVKTNMGNTATLIGKGAGEATVTITATDRAANMTPVEVMVTVEDNVAPMLAMAVEDQTLTRLDPAMVDLSEIFSDSDGDMLEITAMSADESIATVEIVDGSLTITGLAVGNTDITLTAMDPDGLSAETMFKATVENVAPVVAEAITDQTTTRVDDLSVSIGGTFSDLDGNDMFTYTISVEDDSIATVALNGGMIDIVGKSVGTTIVTLTAMDADGSAVSTTFKITIENIAPVAAGSLSPVALEVGGDSASQSIASLFTDDGDELTYTIAVSSVGIASASLAGMEASFAPVSRGEVTATVTASDPHGGMASVSGTVTVGDGELKAMASKSLAGFGRALLSSVSTSVGARLMNDGRDSDLTLDAWNASQEDQNTGALDSSQAWNAINTATTVDTTSTMHQSGVSSIQSLLGSQFALNLGTTDNPSQWSIWGNVDRQSYEGTGYDGLASSVYLGVDVTAGECWLFGVALASNDGESDYTYGTATQTMDMSLTTVLPYVSYQPSDNTTIWGVAGMGSGELDTTVVGADNHSSDLSANVAMVGVRQHLTSAGRLSLDLRGDAAMANIETDDGTNAADGLMAEVTRLRLGLEGSFTSDTGQGGTVTPFGQVNLRSDGGDGDTGTGVEISGGVRLASNAFTLEARGRTLVMHSVDDYSENGFSLMATLNPSQSATGVSVKFAPRWGADAQGMNVLWDDSTNPLQSYDHLVGINDGSSMSLQTQVGYGMLMANERLLVTPFVDVDVSDASRRQVLLGANLSKVQMSKANLAVQFALGRVEERSGDTSGKIGLNATLSF